MQRQTRDWPGGSHRMMPSKAGDSGPGKSAAPQAAAEGFHETGLEVAVGLGLAGRAQPSLGTSCQEESQGRRGDTPPSGQMLPLTTLVEPAFLDDRHLVHGGRVTRCHLAWDSSGQQDMQEARWTEHSLQDKRGAHQNTRGIQPQPLPSGWPGSPTLGLFCWRRTGWSP